MAAGLDEVLAGVSGIAVVKVDAGEFSAPILASGCGLLRRDRRLVVATRERAALRALLEPPGYREAGRYAWTPTWLWRHAGSEPPTAPHPGVDSST